MTLPSGLQFSAVKSGDKLMGIPLYVTFPLLLLMFFFLRFFVFYYFFQFDYYVSPCFPPWVYPVWNSLHFLDLGEYFPSHVKEVLSYYLCKYFLRSFLSLFFCDCYKVNVGIFNVVQEVSYSVFISFHSFFCLGAVISTILSSRTFTYSSASVFLLLISSNLFFMSVLFISVLKFF